MSASTVDVERAPAFDDHAGRVSVRPATGLSARLRSGAWWVVAGRVLGALGTAGATFLIAHVLTEGAFGTFVLVQSVLVVVTRLALAGLAQAVVRLVAEEQGRGSPERAAHVLRLTLRVACCSTAVVTASFWLALRLGGHLIRPEAGLGRLAPWLIASLVALTWQQLTAECLRGFHDLRVASLLSGPFGGALPNALFPIVVLVASRFRPPTIELALASHTASVLLVLPLGLLELRRKAFGPGERPTVEQPVSPRQLLSISLPMMVSDLLTVLTLQADLWLAGLMCLPTDVGLYGAARRLMIIVAIPAQLATLTILSSIPDLHVQRRLSQLQGLVGRAAALAAIPSCIALLGLVALPQFALGLLFGPAYRTAAVPLVVLSCGQLLAALSGPASQTLALTGHHHTVVVVNAAAAAALLAGGLLGASSLGIAGLAVAVAFVTGGQAALFAWLSHRKVGVWTHAFARA